MNRPLRLVVMATIALSLAGPAMAQRLSERIAHVRQQQARQERAAEAQARQHEVSQRLARTIEHVELEGTPAEEALRWWSQQTGVPVVIDWEGMMLDGVDAQTPVTLKLRRVPAAQLLSLLLRQASPDAELIAEATPWYVEVMTRREANRRPVLRIYDVMDLLHTVPDFDNAPRFDLESALGDDDGGDGDRGGDGGGLFGDDDGDDEDTNDPALLSREERAERLMDLIRSIVEPDLWLENGGEHASMRYYHGHLIVSAPNYVHRQIGTPITPRPRPTVRGPRSEPDDEFERRANAPLQGH